MFHDSRIEAIYAVNYVCFFNTLSFVFHVFSFIRLKIKRQPWKAAMENCSLS